MEQSIQLFKVEQLRKAGGLDIIYDVILCDTCLENPSIVFITETDALHDPTTDYELPCKDCGKIVYAGQPIPEETTNEDS